MDAREGRAFPKQVGTSATERRPSTGGPLGHTRANSTIHLESPSNATDCHLSIPPSRGHSPDGRCSGGSSDYSPKTLIPGSQTNTWYVLLLKLDDDSDSTGEPFRTKVYQKDNPSPLTH